MQSDRFSLQSTAHTLFDQEGRLSVDVYDTGSALAVVCPLAGVRTDSLDISIHNDVLTIRAERPRPVQAERLLHDECFWGPCSRTIVLPMAVIGEQAEAEYKHGIMTVRIPKRSTDRAIPITIVEE